MNENSRCSILFHLLVPGGKWQIDISSPVSSASFCNSSFPKTYSGSVTTTGVGGDQQLACSGIRLPPHRLPPSPDALRGKRGGIVIDAHADPSRVARHVIDSIGRRAPQFGNYEIVHSHLFGISLRTYLPPVIFEVADQFFLLRVYRNHRLPAGLKFPDRVVDVVELRVPVGMLTAFQRLAVGLQAVVHLMQ